jgi:hypothetical protein
MRILSKKVVLMALFAAAYCVPVAVWAAPADTATAAPQWNGQNMAERVNAIADRVTEKLGLSAEQRSLFVAMKTAQFQFLALKRQARQDAAAKIQPADLSAARTAMREAIKAFRASLSDTQKTEWKAMRAQFRESRLDAISNRVSEKLNLTPAQSALFVDLVTARSNFRSIMRMSRHSADVTPAEITAAREAVKNAKQAFVASLNPTQAQEFEALRAQFHMNHPELAKEPAA